MFSLKDDIHCCRGFEPSATLTPGLMTGFIGVGTRPDTRWIKTRNPVTGRSPTDFIITSMNSWKLMVPSPSESMTSNSLLVLLSDPPNVFSSSSSSEALIVPEPSVSNSSNAFLIALVVLASG